MTQTIEKVETGSTNNDAKQMAAEGAPHLTVIWAHWQTAGRGRHERQWVSFEGNVFWSIIIRPESNWPIFSDLVYVNALAVRRTLLDVLPANADVRLKWPNDVLLGGRKVSGSLLESGGAWKAGQPEWVVIGTGINVVAHPESVDLRYPATSLHGEGFREVTRDDLVPALRLNLSDEIDRWVGQGFQDVRARYLQTAYALNGHIRVGLSPNKAEYRDGIYRGVDPNGQLLLEVASGEVEKISSGDVILRS